MEIKDFKGISYFRFLVPTLYIFAWIAMIIGPQIQSIFYRQYCFVMTVFLAAKAFYQVILNSILVMKGNAVLERLQKEKQKPNNGFMHPYKELYHAFAIPSYKEDIQILAETLEVLSKHKRAQQSYLIYLAMEEHEEGSDEKARKLIGRFINKFRFINYTCHKIRLNQQKGKASNVSWCVQNMKQIFNHLMINSNDVFVTILDADSWAPNCYFDQLEHHLFQNLHNRHHFIYQPTQIYTRNHMQVPVLVRTYDDMFSSLHASNQITCTGITFSISNYTLSYNLLQKIGFWDTVEEAIAEDFHMCLKAHFKTQGKVKMIPIFAPFNQLCVETGKGNLADLKAKFIQIQRHSRVVSEIGYCILMLFRSQFSFKSLYLVFSVMEMILMPIILPWCLVSTFFFDRIFNVQTPEGLLDPENCMIMVNMASFFMVISCLLFEYYKRKCSQVMYGIENPHLLRWFQGAIFSTINILALMTPAFILGSFGNLRTNREYKVADKAVASKQLIQEVKIDMKVEDQSKKLLNY